MDIDSSLNRMLGRSNIPVTKRGVKKNKVSNTNINNLSLNELMKGKSTSPYSFSQSFKKSNTIDTSKDIFKSILPNSTTEATTENINIKRKISPFFFLGLVMYVAAIFLSVYLHIPQWLNLGLSAIGIVILLIGVFLTAFPKEKTKDLKRKYWGWVNKIREKQNKSIKCLNCGKDDFEINKEGKAYCTKCKELVQ